MSALAIILTVAMVVSADGQEKVSEAVIESRPLELHGKWKGVWHCFRGPNVTTAMNYNEPIDPVQHRIRADWIVDEGNGRCKFTDPGRPGPPSLGIYRQEKNKLIICIRRPGDGRPTEFTREDFQDIVILHRVKSRK